MDGECASVPTPRGTWRINKAIRPYIEVPHVGPIDVDDWAVVRIFVRVDGGRLDDIGSVCHFVKLKDIVSIKLISFSIGVKHLCPSISLLRVGIVSRRPKPSICHTDEKTICLIFGTIDLIENRVNYFEARSASQIVCALPLLSKPPRSCRISETDVLPVDIALQFYSLSKRSDSQAGCLSIDTFVKERRRKSECTKERSVTKRSAPIN